MPTARRYCSSAGLLLLTACLPWARGEQSAADQLLEQVLELNRALEPATDLEAVRKAFRETVKQAGDAVNRARAPEEKVAALNRVLLTGCEVRPMGPESVRDWTLAAMLLRRKANSLAASVLYVLVGEQLGLRQELRMVALPGHTFVRWDDGKVRINIETSREGREVPTAEYLTQWSRPQLEDIELLGWGRSLTQNGFLTEVLQAAAQAHLNDRKLEEAVKLLEQAEALSPARCDIALWRLQLTAELPGRRNEARQRIRELTFSSREPPVPPTVQLTGLLYMADDAAQSQEYRAERGFLLAAFSVGPKHAQADILTRLAFCHRNLKDPRTAALYMEMVAALRPNDPNTLYSYALLLRDDQQFESALAMIRRLRERNPREDNWNLQITEAVYLLLSNRREEAQRVFLGVSRPKDADELYETMRAWFHAVAREREKFYTELGKAVAMARTPRLLGWLEREPDLEPFRGDPEYKALLDKLRAKFPARPETPPPETRPGTSAPPATAPPRAP
jgi:tetratricopeptide (TPR) repeat protein